MGMDDFVDKDVALAIAGTAAVLSGSVRRLLHRGAVYGVAGAMIAGDAIQAFGRGVTRGYRGKTGEAPEAGAAEAAGVAEAAGAAAPEEGGE